MSQYAKYANYVGPKAANSGQQTTDQAAAASKRQAEQAFAKVGQEQKYEDEQQQQTEEAIMKQQQQQQLQHQLLMSSRPSSELSRTSLLGRPLKVETHYRDLRYRKKQNIIYNFLERPRGWRAALYHFAM